MKELFERVKEASRRMVCLDDDVRRAVLVRLAERTRACKAELLAANALDLEQMERSNPLYDRLLLTDSRLEDIARDILKVAALPSPLGQVSKARRLENGLYLRRVSVPFGVIGVIYEARPNVSFDVFSLCFKSGNACLLKGSRSAEHSNLSIVSLIKEVLEEQGVDTNAVALLPSTHEATAELLSAVGWVDLCIPRGGKRLIEFVRDTARVPVIETGAGVVHVYFDKDGDLEKGRAVIANAKLRRVSVCNALDCLLVHKAREKDLPALLEPMQGKVEFVYGDYGTEWMDYKLAIRVVDSFEAALEHIRTYSSGHSECIITENEQTARRFQTMVDAACVYWNASTGFTDGGQFGLGAEIGISTQKLGPRGPMALEEMTTYKWLIDGDGQIRN
ncbi:MAG: glutamate-5-semialdehyde dehydrogenase [Prevotellaceae bacterium]|nr:glutamate-5-semialdehyde dehydrogenase [Prevotellaceae bacterium]